VGNRASAVCGLRPARCWKCSPGGMTPDDVLRGYPYLEKEDIDAWFEYAARHAAHREIFVSK
jgi:hypothetical protein